MELEDDLPLFVDFTLQAPERGYFNPRPEMLALTDKFIEALTLKIEEEIRISRQGNTMQILIMVDTNMAEVYTLTNDGNQAAYRYEGTHIISQPRGNV